MPEPRSYDGFPASLRQEYGPYAAVIEEWHDGDTVKVTLSVGFDEFPCRWIRLRAESGGVNAYELGSPAGVEARDFAASLAPPGTPCKVATQKMVRTGGQQMSFTRYIGTITLADGTDVGAALVEAGYAVYVDY